MSGIGADGKYSNFMQIKDKDQIIFRFVHNFIIIINVFTFYDKY